MQMAVLDNVRTFAVFVSSKLKLLLMNRKIAAVIAPQNCYLLRNIR
jgi:hypothetical protein